MRDVGAHLLWLLLMVPVAGHSQPVANEWLVSLERTSATADRARAAGDADALSALARDLGRTAGLPLHVARTVGGDVLLVRIDSEALARALESAFRSAPGIEVDAVDQASDWRGVSIRVCGEPEAVRAAAPVPVSIESGGGQCACVRPDGPALEQRLRERLLARPDVEDVEANAIVPTPDPRL